MNWILRLIFLLIGQRAKLQVLREAKRHGVVAYMRALQGTRRVLLLALVAFFVLQLMLLSFVGAIVTGFMLWDTDPQFRLQVLFGVFACLFAIPFIGLAVVFNERMWYRLSGAEKMVDDLLGRRSSSEREAA